MQAVILIGGLGTRLRPLTLKTPKPLLSVANRPLMTYWFDNLRAYGIKDVILSIGYRAEDFKKALGDGKRYGLRLKYAQEQTPLGTGGAVKNIQSRIQGTALVLNGDILTRLNLRDLIKTHRSSSASVTIALTQVKDPTLYGLVEMDSRGRIHRFLEKPSWDEIVTNTINAGAYVFEPEVINYIPSGVEYSLERGLFPTLLERGHRLQGFAYKDYWLDVGTLDKYLQAHQDLLNGHTHFSLLGRNKGGRLRVEPGVRLGKSLKIDHRVVLGVGVWVKDFVKFSGFVCVGSHSKIGKGSVLQNCVVLDYASIGEGSHLENCVVGSHCVLEPHVFVGSGRVVADGSVIERYSQL